jgi:two-component system sensor histidine kinase RegB
MFSIWFSTKIRNPLQILVAFRSVAILGQIVAVSLAQLVFNFPLNIVGIVTVLLSMSVINLYTWQVAKTVAEASSLVVFAQLLIDLAALTAIFYFSGGATNPFVSMYLLPLAMGAVLLAQQWVWFLTLIGVVVYSLLMWMFPSDHMQHMGQSFNQHVMGMWLSFLISAIVIAYFVLQMRNALREKEEQLAIAREQTIRDEKLISLGALAASTAHELGTPLATMQLLLDDLDENDISSQQIALLLNQVARCKKALSEMSNLAANEEIDKGALIEVHEYLEGLLHDWQSQRPNIKVSSQLTGPVTTAVIAENALSKALVNLLDNAADASPDAVRVTAQWDKHELQLTIIDEGGKLSDEALSKIGNKPFSNKLDGIGIGAFLAHEIVRRLDGEIMLAKGKWGGLETTIRLPLLKTQAPNQTATVESAE